MTLRSSWPSGLSGNVSAIISSRSSPVSDRPNPFDGSELCEKNQATAVFRLKLPLRADSAKEEERQGRIRQAAHPSTLQQLVRHSLHFELHLVLQILQQARQRPAEDLKFAFSPSGH